MFCRCSCGRSGGSAAGGRCPGCRRGPVSARLPPTERRHVAPRSGCRSWWRHTASTTGSLRVREPRCCPSWCSRGQRSCQHENEPSLRERQKKGRPCSQCNAVVMTNTLLCYCWLNCRFLRGLENSQMQFQAHVSEDENLLKSNLTKDAFTNNNQNNNSNPKRVYFSCLRTKVLKKKTLLYCGCILKPSSMVSPRTPSPTTPIMFFVKR